MTAQKSPLIQVPEPDLLALRRRLADTNWPRPWPASGWDAGTDPRELRRLVEYWATTFDWRQQEASINALPAHTAMIEGTPLTYFRFDAETDDALPLILTNGWPSTVLELIELARRLSTPASYGGHADRSHTVIVPALPGFPFSPPRPDRYEQTHELWHELMTTELGFERYAAHGSDLGAGITSRLAQAHPDHVRGIHLVSVAAPPNVDHSSLTAEEQRYLESVAVWSADEGAYLHQQQTRPLSLAPALSDSPAGLLAWILEKYRSWSDNGGDLGSRFTDDFLLTQASLYWFTNSISTSFRPYYDYASGVTQRVRQVAVPTAVAVFPHDIARPPGSWAERTYNITRYTLMPRGGHFSAHEEPALLAEDISAFLTSLQ
ncbi:epoxide hydrolase family protein [Leifsonia sp. RAF41]|uniref:epoxide hydrolase family protein n=1 Tax=Leifsonia sp. RAF41 TaxID=3233056 RepID=UPI003F96F369